MPPDGSYVVDLSVTLCVGGSPFEVYPVTTDDSGYFDLILPSGTYDILVKNVHTLANRLDDVVIPNGGSTGIIDFGTLREGDANDDNRITSADFYILKPSYNKSLGEPGYDERADFNENDSVTSADFFLLIGHYNQAGDTCATKSKNMVSTSFREIRSNLSNVSVSLEKKNPANGSYIVNVWVHASAQTVNSVDLHLNFDPKTCRVDSVKQTESANWIVMQNEVNQANGWIDYAMVNFTPCQQDFIACSFKVTSTTLQPKSSLEFSFAPVTRNTRVEFNGLDVCKGNVKGIQENMLKNLESR